MTRIDLIFKMRLQESDVSCSIFRDRGPIKNGGVAQLGEHLPCKQGVMGSNPIISTTGRGSGAKTSEPNKFCTLHSALCILHSAFKKLAHSSGG